MINHFHTIYLGPDVKTWHRIWDEVGNKIYVAVKNGTYQIVSDIDAYTELLADEVYDQLK